MLLGFRKVTKEEAETMKYRAKNHLTIEVWFTAKRPAALAEAALRHVIWREILGLCGRNDVK